MLASNAQSGLSNKMSDSSAALRESSKPLRRSSWSGVTAWLERLSIEPCKVYFETCRRARHGSVCDLNLRTSVPPTRREAFMVWTVADDQSRAWASGPRMECKMSFLTSRSSESAALHPTRGTEGTSFKAEPGHNLTSHQEPNDVLALLRAQLGTLVADAAHHVAKECSSARATATVTGSGMHVRTSVHTARSFSKTDDELVRSGRCRAVLGHKSCPEGLTRI